jgi:hypothetical protein
MVKIKWYTSFAFDYSSVPESWKNFLLLDPEKLSQNIKEEIKGDDYLKCPAFLEYIKNVYVIKAPLDLDLVVKYLPNGEKTISTLQYDQLFFDSVVMSRLNQSKDSMLSINFSYCFFSDKPVLVESLPAFMHKTELVKNIICIPATFDISKWIRPIDFTFKIIDDTKTISFKKGDPLFYIRFHTDDKIVMEKIVESEELKKLKTACLQLKRVIPNNTLQKNYEYAKDFLQLVKRKVFKKCPFSH